MLQVGSHAGKQGFGGNLHHVLVKARDGPALVPGSPLSKGDGHGGGGSGSLGLLAFLFNLFLTLGVALYCFSARGMIPGELGQKVGRAISVLEIRSSAGGRAQVRSAQPDEPLLTLTIPRSI